MSRDKAATVGRGKIQTRRHGEGENNYYCVCQLMEQLNPYESPQTVSDPIQDKQPDPKFDWVALAWAVAIVVVLGLILIALFLPAIDARR